MCTVFIIDVVIRGYFFNREIHDPEICFLSHNRTFRGAYNAHVDERRGTQAPDEKLFAAAGAEEEVPVW